MILPEVMAPRLRVVFCGTAAGNRSARTSSYYAGHGNRFRRTRHEIGLRPVLLAPSEYRRLLDYGIGLTDLCKVRSGSDRAVGADGFDIAHLAELVKQYRPA